MAKTPQANVVSATKAASGLITDPPAGGCVVRMYRIGHGDCFLLSFPRAGGGKPVFVMIDCGYKPGSTAKIPILPKITVDEVISDLKAVTGGTIDVVVLTHEHQDHLNGITKSRFEDIRIGELWLAWTEDPKDPLANALRTSFNDRLVGLVAAHQRMVGLLDERRALGLAESPEGLAEERRINRLGDLLAFELGGASENYEEPRLGLSDDTGILALDGIGSNKAAMALCKRNAAVVRFLSPHEAVRKVPNAGDVRAFALGPPREEAKIEDLDPEGEEKFHLALETGATGFLSLFGATSEEAGAAACADPDGWTSPFHPRYAVPLLQAGEDPDVSVLFSTHYSGKPSPTSIDEIADNAEFRRIDGDWLGVAEQIALDMNDYTNNASLVLAFELSPGGKVLLFAADAQRGNWISWADKQFTDADRTVTARDLLSRTVLYKAGHHGSHNATLNGTKASTYPCLEWMGEGQAAGEFTAMITAVWPWAQTQKGWIHPLPAIKSALIEKASGRVFQTDTSFTEMTSTPGAESAWATFAARSQGSRLWFDLRIEPG